MSRVRAGLLALAVGFAGLIVPSTAHGSTPPPGWTAYAHIPGSTGQLNQVSARAANGSDAIVWFKNDTGGVELAALVRVHGTSRWRKVPPRVANVPSAQNQVIAAAPNGDFWVAWITNGSPAEVFAMRLDPAARKWTKPMQVFSDTGFGHIAPQIAVAGDGTVGITAAAMPVTYSNPPVYRAEVGLLHPGGRWQTHFLSPATSDAGDEAIAASSAGHFVVSWTLGYLLGDETVRAATHAPGTSASWHSATLSVAGDSQRAHPSVGPDGTAAVVWSATSSSYTAVRMSTTKIGAGAPTWTRNDVVTSTTVGFDAYPVVYKNGDVSATWTESATGPSGLYVLWTRLLSHGALGDPVQVSADGFTAAMNPPTLRPDGKVALLYQLFVAGPNGNRGVRYRTMHHGVLDPELTMTDETDGDGEFQTLGVDAAGQDDMSWQRGDYPTTDFVYMRDVATAPAVMTSAFSGHALSHAHVKGHPHVGHTLACTSGVWVEAHKLTYSWYRNGSKIAHRTTRKHHVRHADLHKRLSCHVTGSDTAGNHRTVTSKRRRIS